MHPKQHIEAPKMHTTKKQHLPVVLVVPQAVEQRAVLPLSVLAVAAAVAALLAAPGVLPPPSS
jgi:hypothetical protein